MPNLKRDVILPDKAPKPIGPYSAGIRAGDFVFTAGQIGIDARTGELIPGGIQDQTRQVLFNLGNILQASGSSLASVVKTTVFLKDMSEFAEMNAVYGEFFKDSPPARSTVEVAALPKGALVEIECIAIVLAARGD